MDCLHSFATITGIWKTLTLYATANQTAVSRPFQRLLDAKLKVKISSG